MNRTFDSNGPDVKIRGTAAHIYEKYQALARDAHASGDRVGAENLLQHAEHYYRILNAYQVSQAANGAYNGGARTYAPPADGPQPDAMPGQPRPNMPREGSLEARDNPVSEDIDDASDVHA
jgi:hypothetical protein